MRPQNARCPFAGKEHVNNAAPPAKIIPHSLRKGRDGVCSPLTHTFWVIPRLFIAPLLPKLNFESAPRVANRHITYGLIDYAWVFTESDSLCAGAATTGGLFAFRSSAARICGCLIHQRRDRERFPRSRFCESNYASLHDSIEFGLDSGFVNASTCLTNRRFFTQIEKSIEGLN